MKESYSEGLAGHTGPESCLDDPRGRGEALTGESVGWLLSSEITFPGGRDSGLCAKATHEVSLSDGPSAPASRIRTRPSVRMPPTEPFTRLAPQVVCECAASFDCPGIRADAAATAPGAAVARTSQLAATRHASCYGGLTTVRGSGIFGVFQPLAVRLHPSHKFEPKSGNKEFVVPHSCKVIHARSYCMT